MTDLVERLRGLFNSQPDKEICELLDEAADRIEALEKELETSRELCNVIRSQLAEKNKEIEGADATIDRGIANNKILRAERDALVKEREGLRNALEQIAHFDYGSPGSHPATIARAALGGEA